MPSGQEEHLMLEERHLFYFITTMRLFTTPYSGLL